MLSDEFLDSIAVKPDHRNVQVRLLQKLLDREIKGRMRTNPIRAREFGEQLADVLARYEQRQISGQEVIERLIDLAKRMRDSARRHEDLGLTTEEMAFYDALARGPEHLQTVPGLADLARELVTTIRTDLSVDWTDRAGTEAKVRTKIKRLLRRHRDQLPLMPVPTNGGGDQATLDPVNYFADLIVGQAKALYRYWPEVGDRLFDEA